jgi:hypothetical protein
VRVAVVPGSGTSGLLCELAEDGSPRNGPVRYENLAAAIGAFESNAATRLVWSATTDAYPRLLHGGARVARCHDIALVAGLLAARDGDGSWPVGTPATAGRPSEQEALFGAEQQRPDQERAMRDLITEYAGQVERIAADEHPARFGLLAAAESAGGLAAAEMTAAGLPWRAELHEALLADLLGPRPAAGARPARLAALAARITAAFGASRPVNPDSPAQLQRALAAAGIRVPSTRLRVLTEIEHPAIPPLIEYKELSRLHSAFGWSWLDTWVSGGRFRPEYVVGGVVSGRWASRGGGALQIPRLLRRAVVADPGWVLVVADAAQLEPRVLAALSGDRAMAQAAAGQDLYAGLADAFGGDRAKAKVALLSAMYGGAGGEARQLLAVLRRRFTAASDFVEAAARAGEEGRVVRSVLGRTCPPPSADWRALTAEATDPDTARQPGAERAARARGRFTRKFVVPASAADWALVFLAALRARLMTHNAADPRLSLGPELVFFQHDEVLVHSPQEQADAVSAAIAEAASEATRLVFGSTPVAFPMTVIVVGCYADAK